MFGLLYGLYATIRVIGESGLDDYHDQRYKKYCESLKTMDVWEGLWKQIKYDRECDIKDGNIGRIRANYLYSAYWKGDREKPIKISEAAININKKYRASGLSPLEFCKEYYANLYKHYVEHGADIIFRGYDRFDIYEDYDKVIKISIDSDHMESWYEDSEEIRKNDTRRRGFKITNLDGTEEIYRYDADKSEWYKIDKETDERYWQKWDFWKISQEWKKNASQKNKKTTRRK